MRATVRTRLTLLYGGLFLLCGVGLLATTYVLLRYTNVGLVQNDQGVVAVRQDGTIVALRGDASGEALPPEQAEAANFQLLKIGGAERRAFLIRSGIALTVASAASLGLGWLVAGRVLRPVRTITTSTRRISAANLHRRLALDGPDDELKELGDTIDDLLARLEASFASQRRFVANASHELRTPLTRQRLVAQVALADPDATVDSLRAAHERVLHATYHEERLIDALLTLARGERGLDRRQPVDLAGITEDVLLVRDAEATRRGVRLTAPLAPARISGDPHLIERLVVNLVDNALRHNVPSGRLDVSTTTLSGVAVLTVTNTGPVVPVDQVARLFEPFQRLDTDRTHHDDGHGLGLSIVQAIATAHDATIEALARPEGGLAITVTFPSAGA